MLTLIKRLSLNYIKIFAYMSIIALFFRLLMKYIDNPILTMINAIWILTSTTIMIALSTYFLYEFIYTKRYYFYHTLKYSIHEVLVILSAILIVFNLIYYIIYSNFNLYDFIQKTISLISYFSILILLLYFFRSINSKKIATNLILFSLLVLIAIYPVIFNLVFKDELGFVMIGVNSNEGIRNIYTTILPLTLFEKEIDYSLFSKYTLVINSIITLICGFLFTMIREIKINWR